MDYKNGRIYKITSNSTDKIYIGSTCQPLSKRMTTHRNDYKKFINGKCGKITSFELIKLGDAIITLIEDFPCERKEQLHARERYYIELNKDICVNKIRPTITQEERKDYKNKWYESNKEEIAEQHKIFRQENKDLMAERNKVYYQNNKEKIAKYKKQTITCICGAVCTILHKTRHEKTNKHLAFIQSQS